MAGTEMPTSKCTQCDLETARTLMWLEGTRPGVRSGVRLVVRGREWGPRSAGLEGIGRTFTLNGM